MDHLALEIFSRDLQSSQFANLPDNASITIIITSEIFDNGSLWSYPFTLNIFANPHIFGSAGDIHGSYLHEQIDRLRARLWVDGLPMYYGYLRLSDEAEINKNGDVSITFESGKKTFQDMIDGGKANQVPMMGDVLIGMALDPNRTLDMDVDLIVSSREFWPTYGRPFPITIPGMKIKGIENLAQQYPKFVRPDGTWKELQSGEILDIQEGELTNTDYAYDDGHPYCNIKLCYQQYKYFKNGDNIEKVRQREYQVKDPRSINPAPNFYVIYWLRALMKHLGVHIEENQMMGVEDLRRLFFVNTKCAYTTKPDDGNYRGYENGIDMDRYVTFGYWNPIFPVTDDPDKNPTLVVNDDDITVVAGSKPYDLSVKVRDNRTTVHNITDTVWHKAYASKECFPDVDIKDVISALENGFGVRFLFSDNYTRVRVVLLRNIFRSQEVHKIECDVTECVKTENSIKGVRMTYGAEADNTDYNYKGFMNQRKNATDLWDDDTDTHDYSQFNFTVRYDEIASYVTPLNKTCYVDSKTGNSFIIKIDKDAKTPDEWNPSLFECGEFMDAEVGDCTGDEETIYEISLNFNPIISNNVDKEAAASLKQDFMALFVSEEMGVPGNVDIDTRYGDTYNMSKDGTVRDENGYCGFLEQPEYQSGLFAVATSTPFDAYRPGEAEPAKINIRKGDGTVFSFYVHGKIREGYNLYLQDNYDVNDDLKIPIEEHDWGLTFGIMRGSGSTAVVKTWTDPDDMEGNDTWGVMPGGNATAHHDICDNYGNIWEYKSVTPGKTGYTGYEFGDKLLSDFGCQNQCDLKTKMGPDPNEPRTKSVIQSYTNYQLLILTHAGYYATVAKITDKSGVEHTVWICCVMDGSLQVEGRIADLVNTLQYGSGSHTQSNYPTDAAEILSRGASAGNDLIAVDPTTDESILSTACVYYLQQNTIVQTYADDRVSLKLRAEKPNPYFDPTLPESSTNKRYLEITDPNLRQRGLMDRFYKEYSYWLIHGRVANMQLTPELAQLQSIDMTVKQEIGDITGYIKKMQLKIDKRTGLGPVNAEVMYL